MRLRMGPALALAAVAVGSLACSSPGVEPPTPSPMTLPYLNPDLPLEERVTDLVGRMTLEEKVSQTLYDASAIDRLGIPEYNWWNEALHGVARAGRATVFPQAIGLAATWDARLMFRVATAISDEARAKYHESLRKGRRGIYEGLTFWSPNINIFRDPRWGRGMETYGEDPYLTGRLAVEFVRGMQGDDPTYLKTVATPKHFAVHSGPEPDRHTFDAVVDERGPSGNLPPGFPGFRDGWRSGIRHVRLQPLSGASRLRQHGAPPGHPPGGVGLRWLRRIGLLGHHGHLQHPQGGGDPRGSFRASAWRPGRI